MPFSLSHRFALASAAVSAVFFSLPGQAQILPDGTLGTQVFGACGGTGGACGIINGTTRGSNLFHSFLQFSLPNGDFAAFAANPAIRNVIVRVTGADISNINGTIATVDPTFTNVVPTNFFLLNPNGIVFGPGATLLNGGSFLATAAERMLFQDGRVFSARDPTPNPILTVSVPVGLQFGQTPGNIQMQRTFLSAGNTDRFSDFALVGGDVTLDNSVIQAPRRRVELGGVASAGTVGLTTTGNGLSFSFPDGLPRANVSITNRSSVDVLGIDGGSLAVTARNLDISGGSRLIAGIFSGLGFTGSQAGDITLNATDTITVRQTSGIINLVQTRATGNAGNLLLSTGSISVTEGSQLNASTFGTGNGQCNHQRPRSGRFG